MRIADPPPRRTGPASLAIACWLLAGLPAAATAASACPEHYPGGVAPRLVRPSLAAETRELCFRAFAVLHSGVSRTPLAAAEHLTRRRVRAARRLEREASFRDEDRLPPEQRARLSDYARSGFDRGHMAPSGDMPTAEAQAESFSLANVVPQAPGSNRCLWEGVESAVRELALREGEAWVLTGPIFQGATLERLNGRVLVPTSLYKAVYLPGRRAAAAYVAPNGPGMEWRALSLDALRDLAGIDAFPALPPEVKARAMALPQPRPRDLYGGCDAAVARARPAPPAGGGGPGPGRTALALAALTAVVAGAVLYRALGRRRSGSGR